MALPATDNFNRANGALGANWAGSVGSDLAISSNQCVGTSGDSSMYWSADAPNAAQYAQCKCVDATDFAYLGPNVRQDADDFVTFQAVEGTQWSIYWYNGGAWTLIGSAYTTDPVANDIAKITADGTTFKGYVNGTERCSGSNASAPATGYGGIYIYGADAVDDFEVGNLGGAAASLVPSIPLKYAVPSLVR